MQKNELSEAHNNSETKKERISYWCNLYLQFVVKGSSTATFEAKKRDLSLFIDFANSLGVSDQADQLFGVNNSEQVRDKVKAPILFSCAGSFPVPTEAWRQVRQNKVLYFYR